MENEKYLNDISEIKNMMSKSSQFISLSGFSGIIAGVYALIGAITANYIITHDGSMNITLESLTFKYCITIAFIVLVLSVGTAYLLTLKKAKKQGEKIWNPTTRKLIVNFCIPLFTGGIFAIELLLHSYFGIIAPIILVFYGMACVNASKYTLRDVRYLGLTMIIIGIIALEFPGYGLHFWALGFGICHIIYGSMMYYKYDRN
jgi:uncharacterized membrane protein YgdD (TMEM256/DUF423 family)